MFTGCCLRRCDPTGEPDKLLREAGDHAGVDRTGKVCKASHPPGSRVGRSRLYWQTNLGNLPKPLCYLRNTHISAYLDTRHCKICLFLN